MAPTATAALDLSPRQPDPEASLVWAFLSLLSPVFLRSSAGASVPHRGQRPSCSGTATQRLCYSRAPTSRPTQNPRWGSEVTSLSIFSHTKNTTREPQDLINDAVYNFLEDATIFCKLWGCFGHSEDCSPFSLSIHTFSPSFKHTSSSLPPTHLSVLSSLSLSRILDPITCTLVCPDGVEGSGWSQPTSPAGSLVAYLLAILGTSSCWSHFSAVHSLLLSLICFFISPLRHTIEIQRKILKEQLVIVSIAPSVVSTPLTLHTDSAHTLECKAEKLEALSLLVAFLRFQALICLSVTTKKGKINMG